MRHAMVVARAALGMTRCQGQVGARRSPPVARPACCAPRRTWARRFGVPVAETPRVLLALPFVSQPPARASRPVLVAVGVAVLAGSLFFATPVVRIVAFTGPSRREPLRTDGLYSVIRHPLMLR
jgi:protein-S-isoprenylcysteine O-methyltransferase Ste14